MAASTAPSPFRPSLERTPARPEHCPFPAVPTSLIRSRSEAEALAERLNALGTKITAVSPQIGVASTTKLCRSIIIEGMAALMVDLRLAGQKAGCCPPCSLKDARQGHRPVAGPQSGRT
jgi:hypothetical protein